MTPNPDTQQPTECDACSGPDACEKAGHCEEYDAPLVPDPDTQQIREALQAGWAHADKVPAGTFQTALAELGRVEAALDHATDSCVRERLRMHEERQARDKWERAARMSDEGFQVAVKRAERTEAELAAARQACEAWERLATDEWDDLTNDEQEALNEAHSAAMEALCAALASPPGESQDARALAVCCSRDPELETATLAPGAEELHGPAGHGTRFGAGSAEAGASASAEVGAHLPSGEPPPPSEPRSDVSEHGGWFGGFPYSAARGAAGAPPG